MHVLVVALNHRPFQKAAFDQPILRTANSTDEIAMHLSQVFGGNAESWLVQQAQYDLTHVRKDRIKLKRLEPV